MKIHLKKSLLFMKLSLVHCKDLKGIVRCVRN